MEEALDLSFDRLLMMMMMMMIMKELRLTVPRMCHTDCFPPLCNAASVSTCPFSIILEEARNKKLIQRSETIRAFADVNGDANSQYRSWETGYVERKEKNGLPKGAPRQENYC